MKHRRTRFLSVNVEMASEKRGAVRGNRETASEKAEQHVDIGRKKEGGWKIGTWRDDRHYGNSAVSQY